MAERISGFGMVFSQWINAKTGPLPDDSVPHVAMLFDTGAKGPKRYQVAFGKYSGVNHRFERWDGKHHSYTFPAYYQILV